MREEVTSQLRKFLGFGHKSDYLGMSNVMQLLRLDGADIFRDGGSYEACFSTDEPLPLRLLLKVDNQLRLAGLGRHRYLYVYRSESYVLPTDALPIITGSEEEQQILQLLESFLESTSDDVIESAYALKRLREMVEDIPQRAPCLPDDPIFIAKK